MYCARYYLIVCEIWVTWLNELLLYDGAGLIQFWASSCVAATSNCTHVMKSIWKVQSYRVGTHKVR